MSESSDPSRPPSAGTPSQAPGAVSRPAQTYALASNVHILDHLAILYRYRRIALAVFVLTTIALMIQGYSNVQLFQAKAQVMIEDERSTAMPGIAASDYYADPVPYYNTQFRILRGRDLARRVVRKVNLQDVPEFNGTSKPAPTPITMVRDSVENMLRKLTRTRPVQEEAPKPDETAAE